MACRTIGYNPETSDFRFGGRENTFTFAEVGAEIGKTLASGSEVVNFGSVKVTVTYLTIMMRFARMYGWFFDSFEDAKVGDHYFDYNNPTPGAKWAKIQELRRAVRQCHANARRAAAAQHADEHYWNQEAATALATINEYLRTGK